MPVPLYVLFVNQSNNLIFAKQGGNALSENLFFLHALTENQRIILCADSIRNSKIKVEPAGSPIEIDLVYPYSQFSA